MLHVTLIRGGTASEVVIDRATMLTMSREDSFKTEGPIVQEKGALMDMHRVGIGRRVGVQPPFGHPDLRIEMVMG